MYLVCRIALVTEHRRHCTQRSQSIRQLPPSMLLNSKLVGVIGPSKTDLDACRANRKAFESTDEVPMAAVRISFACS